MTRRVSVLTPDLVHELPTPCVSCLAWEIDPERAAVVKSSPEAVVEKAAWCDTVSTHWGHCGQVVRIEDVVVGYVTYAPPERVPRAATFPTSPVSPDAILFLTGGVLQAHRGGGLGRLLMQSMAADLSRRGFRAIEVFGSTRRTQGPLGSERGCLVPAGFLTAVGFRVVRPHRETPRLRLDLRTASAWKEDVEAALERILGTMRVPALDPRPTLLSRAQ